MPDSGRPRVVGPQRRGGDGDAEVFVADEQTLPVDLERWATLARDVLYEEGVRGNTELSLLFLSEEAIAELNLEFMGVNAAHGRARVPHRCRSGHGWVPHAHERWSRPIADRPR